MALKKEGEMYLDFLVKIPEVKGKITLKPKGNAVYINYEYGRQYDSMRKFNIPRRTIIGKQSKEDKSMMQPNQNFLTYFPEVELPDEKFNSKRSSCLKIGSYLVIKKLMEEYGLPEMLSRQFEGKGLGLFQDLMAYSLVCENNAGQYYPDYAYNHPLFTEHMHIYSDSKVSDFLNSITDDHSVGFLNDWNEQRDHREKIYISYDSTNKNCQAGEIEMVEFGKAKVDIGKPIFNYSIAYDTHNREPLFYEKYPGSIVDVSQLQYTLEKVRGYGYRKVGFILDRGYFSRDNIEFMDESGYDFVIMVKGMASLVDHLVLSHKGMFEEDRTYSIRRHQVYGMTVKRKLYVTDKKERYFHIYHSTGKEHGEKEAVEDKLEKLGTFLDGQVGRSYVPGEKVLHYYDTYVTDDGIFVKAKEKKDVIERELKLCGYFVIVTSQKMTAEEAIDLYYSRDASEKLFKGDKSYLGNRSIRNHSSEAASAKIFLEFVALIIRNRIYTRLKDEVQKLDKKPNFMTVPAAIRELEKIEIVRGLDRIYRMDHAVTANQKTILKAFGMDVRHVKEGANRISEQLRNADEMGV